VAKNIPPQTFFKNWMNLNGFIEDHVGGSATPGWTSMELQTGASAGNKASVYSSVGLYIYDDGRQHRFAARCYYHMSSPADFTSHWGLFETPSSPTTNTQNHVGFVIEDDAGTMKLFATNGNGTSQTKTEIATLGSYAGYNFFFIADYSVPSVKFYVDGSLVATHTTNVPTSLLQVYALASIITSANANKRVWVFPFMLSQRAPGTP